MSDLRVIVEADGGSRGNPGTAGYGAVVRAAATGEILLERYASLGITTNNVAEYTGLIEGLRAAAELTATHVDVRMDSKLVIEQMSGRWQIKNPGLRPLAAEAARLAARFVTVTYEWIPRERNKIADGLANRAIAERLVLSERTVETHVRNLLTKLGLANRTQVAAWALRAGLRTGTAYKH